MRLPDDIDEQLNELLDELESAFAEEFQEELEKNAKQNPFGGQSPFGSQNPFDVEFGTQQEEESPAGMSEVYEDGDDIVVVVDLPGFEENQISLTADEHQVRINAEANDEMRRESMSQMFRLPAEVVADEASATLENGVLTVRLPRAADDETTIDIE